MGQIAIDEKRYFLFRKFALEGKRRKKGLRHGFRTLSFSFTHLARLVLKMIVVSHVRLLLLVLLLLLLLPPPLVLGDGEKALNLPGNSISDSVFLMRCNLRRYFAKPRLVSVENFGGCMLCGKCALGPFLVSIWTA